MKPKSLSQHNQDSHFFSLSSRSKALFTLNTLPVGPISFKSNFLSHISSAPVLYPDSRNKELAVQIIKQRKISPGPAEYMVLDKRTKIGPLFKPPYFSKIGHSDMNIFSKNIKIGPILEPLTKEQEKNDLRSGEYEIKEWKKKGFRFGKEERMVIFEQSKGQGKEDTNNESKSYEKIIDTTTMETKKKTDKIKKRGSSFGKETTFWNKRVIENDLGPGHYKLDLPTSEVGCKFKKAARFKSAAEIKVKPSSPTSLVESEKDVVMPDSKIIKRLKELKIIELENEKISTNYRKFHPSMRKKKETLKERALKLIEQTVQRMEEKEKAENIRNKRNIGFTSLPRKNEFLDPQAIFKSPGPIYNLRDSISYSKSVKFPIEMRKELFLNEGVPGPGSYEISSTFNLKKKRKKKNIFETQII